MGVSRRWALNDHFLTQNSPPALPCGKYILAYLSSLPCSLCISISTNIYSMITSLHRTPPSAVENIYLVYPVHRAWIYIQKYMSCGYILQIYPHIYFVYQVLSLCPYLYLVFKTMTLWIKHFIDNSWRESLRITYMLSAESPPTSIWYEAIFILIFICYMRLYLYWYSYLYLYLYGR